MGVPGTVTARGLRDRGCGQTVPAKGTKIDRRTTMGLIVRKNGTGSSGTRDCETL